MTKLSEITSRIPVSSDITIYVRNDGSDTNSGLVNNSSGAFLTYQKAVDYLATLDGRGYNATISNTTNGTFAPFQTKSTVGFSTVIFSGNGSGTVVNGNSAFSFGNYELTNIRFNGTYSVVASTGAVITINSGCSFGGSGIHITIQDGAKLLALSAYTVVSGGISHLTVDLGSVAEIANVNITISGSPSFSGSFLDVGAASAVYFFSTTFTGSATGKSYSVADTGFLLNTGVTIPGSTAGTRSFTSLTSVALLRITSVNENVVSAYGRINTVSTRITSVNENVVSALNRIGVVSGKLTSVNTRLVNLSATLENRLSTVSALAGSGGYNDALISARITSVNENVTSALTKIATVSGRITSVNENTTSALNRIGVVSGKLTSVNTRLVNLSATLENRLSAVSALAGSGGYNDALISARITSVNSRVATVSTKGTSVNSKLTTTSARITSVNNKHEKYILLVTSVVTSSNVLANVSGMSFTVSSSSNYIVQLIGNYKTEATTTGLALALDIPSGFVVGQVKAYSSNTALVGHVQVADNTTPAATTGAVAANADQAITAEWHVRTTTAGGTVLLRIRSEVNLSRIILAGSRRTVLMYKKI